MIDVTGVDLVKFAQDVYDLSVPAGLGFLHARDGGLSEEDAKELVCHFDGNAYSALDMDYVHGRCCKMHVRREGGRLTICDSWYDHTDAQLNTLLQMHGLCSAPSAEHGCACECVECRTARQPRENAFPNSRGEAVTLTGTIADVIGNMHEGDVAAQAILLRMVSNGEGGFMDLLHLDDMNIRGKQISEAAVLCGGSIEVLREKVRSRDPAFVADLNNCMSAMAFPYRAVEGGASSRRWNDFRL